MSPGSPARTAAEASVRVSALRSSTRSPRAPESRGIPASLTRVFKAIEKIQKGSHERLGTGQLNRLIADAFSQQPAALRNGKRFKVLYATVPEPRSDEPIPLPEIVLFCNNPKYLDEHFKRYLDSCIRQQLPYTGLPLMFRFRGREERGHK